MKSASFNSFTHDRKCLHPLLPTALSPDQSSVIYRTKDASTHLSVLMYSTAEPQTVPVRCEAGETTQKRCQRLTLKHAQRPQEVVDYRGCCTSRSGSSCDNRALPLVYVSTVPSALTLYTKMVPAPVLLPESLR